MKLRTLLGTWSIVTLVILVGWIMNIVAVFHMATSDTPLTTLFILRIVGIVIPPLGAIVGFFF